MRVWLQSGEAAYVEHIPEEIGKMKTLEEWAQEGVQQHQLSASFTRNSPQPVSLQAYFMRLEHLKYASISTYNLNALLAIALQNWFERL